MRKALGRRFRRSYRESPRLLSPTRSNQTYPQIGFDFRQRRALPTMAGIVVAAESAELLYEARLLSLFLISLVLTECVGNLQPRSDGGGERVPQAARTSVEEVEEIDCGTEDPT